MLFQLLPKFFVRNIEIFIETEIINLGTYIRVNDCRLFKSFNNKWNRDLYALQFS